MSPLLKLAGMVMLFSSVALLGCDKQDDTEAATGAPASEEVGKAMSETAEKVEEKVATAAEMAGEAAEEAGDAIEEAAEDTGEAIEEATDKMK